ncbi:FUSC family membrane protein [Celerinatantimonas yamalensis]|uniref:FUSC family membrane protein n=1 Tax=Celerinatantimonas yamalensis TaxID=559956 RepID=A0ABW9G2F7_9GAMM
MHSLFSYLKTPPVNHPQFWIAVKATLLIIFILLGVYLHLPMVHLSTLAFGVVAAALADHPALYVHRAKAMLVMFGCFTLAAGSVTALYSYPWLFALGLFSSTFIFVMLAGLEVRFGPIAMSALILAIYTMLGYGQYTGQKWQQPLYLLVGALSYVLLSFIINALKPNQNLAQQSHTLFTLLAKYQSQKAQFFSKYHNDETLRRNLAGLTGEASSALAQMRSLLVIRQAQYPKANQNSDYLDLFFKAQLLIERIVSSHVNYAQLNQKLSDTVISQQLHFIMLGLAKRIAWQAKPRPIRDRLQHEIASLAQTLRGNYQLKRTLGEVDYNQLSFMLNNLSEMERLTREKTVFPSHDFKFEQLPVLNWANFWQQITQPTGLLFRHALRQALCMLTGFLIIMLIPGPIHGQNFWLLLTTLLVMKPNYAATKQRLVQRIVGTLIGIAIATGLLLLKLPLAMMIVAVALSCLLFFWYFSHRYALAVVMITIFVALALQLLGVKSEFTIVIRMIATLLGGLLVYIAIRFIWPDWLENHTQQRTNTLLTRLIDYQSLIFNHYQHHQADENEPYRLARFNLHVAEAEFVKHQQALFAEPSTRRRDVTLLYHLTGYIHSYIAHLSTLSLYRGRQLSPQASAIIIDIGQQLTASLNQLRAGEHSPEQLDETTLTPAITLKLRELMPNLHGEELLIAFQLQQLTSNLCQIQAQLAERQNPIPSQL